MKIVQWNKDFDYVMSALKFMMWPVGNWPLQNYNVFAAVRTTVALTSMLAMLTLACAEISLGGNSADKNVDIIMIIFNTSLVISKTSFYRFHAADLVCNFDSAVRDHAATLIEQERTIMRQHGFMAKMALVGSMFLMYFDIVVYSLLPLLAEDVVDNRTMQFDTLRYPVPVGNTMTMLNLPDSLYAVIFIAMCLVLLVIASGTIGSDCLFFAITIHLCGQVEVLKVRFSKFIESDRNKSGQFAALTSRHQYLLGLAAKLNSTITNVLIIQLCLSSILICIVGFQLILALKFKDVMMIMKSVVVLSTYMVQLSSYSYVSDYLKCQMEDLGRSAFHCGWHESPKNVTRDVAFVIMRAQRPTGIRAGKFFVLTMETFMGLLKTSMSYLSVLRVIVND